MTQKSDPKKPGPKPAPRTAGTPNTTDVNPELADNPNPSSTAGPTPGGSVQVPAPEGSNPNPHVDSAPQPPDKTAQTGEGTTRYERPATK